MALIWKSSVVSAPEVADVHTSGFSWDAWYAKNKARLSEKRAKRYREDADYRAVALKRSREQREAKKKTVTDGHTVSFNDAAEELGVTVWVLREWRRKDYFPEPFRRNGRLWFKPSQVNLLQRLHQFFKHHGARLAAVNRNELEETTGLVYANW